MVLNKKGQVMALTFMVAVVVIILAIAFAPTLNEINTMARNETSSIGGMDCDSTTSDFTKAACWVLDLNQAYFIGGLIALAGSIIVLKAIIPGE
jgi:uncharacterized protein (UPF0333 family)